MTPPLAKANKPINFLLLTDRGTTELAGSGWREFRTDDDRTLLRATKGTVTVLVTGNADSAELATLAGSLR